MNEQLFEFDIQFEFIKQKYYEDAEISYLLELIRSDKELSSKTRGFIADIIEGKVKRSRGGRKNTHQRDFDIACKIYSLCEKGFSLTSNSDANGAALTIATEYGVSEDVALKAYQRKINDIKTAKLIDLQAWSGFMEDNPDLFP